MAARRSPELGMSGTSTPTRDAHEREVELIDATAIRRALSGCPVALTAMERGVVISIADTHGMDREVVAKGLGFRQRAGVDAAITRARRAVSDAEKNVLAAAAWDRAMELVEAVQDEDAQAVSAALCDLDRQGLAALAVVLADLVVRAGEAT